MVGSIGIWSKEVVSWVTEQKKCEFLMNHLRYDWHLNSWSIHTFTNSALVSYLNFMQHLKSIWDRTSGCLSLP